MMYPSFDYNPQTDPAKTGYAYNVSGWSKGASTANFYYNYDVPY